MRLIQRVSAFFLFTLAFSLAGNAVMLGGLIRYFMHQRFEQQLYAVLYTLVASVEVEHDDVKWEPSDHTISIGSEDEVDDVRWVVFDEADRVVEHSRNLSPTGESDSRLFELMYDDSRSPKELSETYDWLVLHQELSAVRPKPKSQRTSKEFGALRIVVARSPREMRSNLWQLAFLIGGVSIGIWVVAAVLGTHYVRRTLQPLHDMARRAHSVKDADFQIRLPVGRESDELDELSTAFNGLLDRLQVAFEQQQRFTGDAAHQMRTPLTVLLGHIDVALRRLRTVDDYQQTLNVLRVQTAELIKIVETLLFLARVEGQTALPEVHPSDAREALLKCLHRWNEHPRHCDLKLIAPDPIWLSTSWPLFDQLIDNLIGNAFKYSKPGTPVTLWLSRESNNVVFNVEDQGCGIAVEEQSAIFRPFYRTQTARQSGVVGSGLGLAICARIAKALQGVLGCESTLGKGSRFRLILPSGAVES